ncbi:hypothetical protein LZ30DRAFT_309139 [Colletotrichum cereale]|nr:hypothetical protein LZ30DRAFT_309139 [Colletotrichum cereale]
MRPALLLAGVLAGVLSRATPVGTRAAADDQIAADLEPGVPPFFASLMQAYALRVRDEAALIAEVEDGLRDERAGIEAFFVEFRAHGADDDAAAAAAATTTTIQRRGTASHALFDADVESATEQWARAAGSKNDDNRALINRCLREAETDKVRARETTKTKTNEEEGAAAAAASIVVEGLPRSCGELMQQWRGLEGHAAEVRVVGSDALEFSL